MTNYVVTTEIFFKALVQAAIISLRPNKFNSTNLTLNLPFMGSKSLESILIPQENFESIILQYLKNFVETASIPPTQITTSLQVFRLIIGIIDNTRKARSIREQKILEIARSVPWIADALSEQLEAEQQPQLEALLEPVAPVAPVGEAPVAPLEPQGEAPQGQQPVGEQPIGAPIDPQEEAPPEDAGGYDQNYDEENQANDNQANDNQANHGPYKKLIAPRFLHSLHHVPNARFGRIQLEGRVLKAI